MSCDTWRPWVQMLQKSNHRCYQFALMESKLKVILRKGDS